MSSFRVPDLAYCLTAVLVIGGCVYEPGDDASGGALAQESHRQPAIQFTRSLVYKDFDADGVGDWGAGYPTDGACGAGTVQVFHDAILAVPERSLVGSGACDGGFGEGLAVADFNTDGVHDLAVGEPGHAGAAGAVWWFQGSKSGVINRARQVEGEVAPSPGDAFGTSLVAGDFDCDGRADLAVGAPGESGQGAVHVFYAQPDGSLGNARTIACGDIAACAATAVAPFFGSFLAAGEVDVVATSEPRCDDLIIAAPGPDEPVPGIERFEGMVVVVPGDPGGLRADDAGVLRPPRSEVDQPNLRFGNEVWVADVNLAGVGDVVIHAAGDGSTWSFAVDVSGWQVLERGAPRPSGALRDACIWLCNLAWLLLPPGPACDCDGCEIAPRTPESPCPHCV